MLKILRPLFPRNFSLSLFCFLGLFISPVLVLSACAADQAAERQKCVDEGWHEGTAQVSGLTRHFFWKAPEGAWTKGAILVLHGGGGYDFQWCHASRRFLTPQTQFTKQAVADGFAVFILDSSDAVTDTQGFACGKIWDDEERPRANLDLPFIEYVIKDLVPHLRPANSQQAVFMTGLSSGGYMSVRASTHFNNLITAFAPVSNGDPYGWHRKCIAALGKRKIVHGAGFDNETDKEIIEEGSCASAAYPHEQKWDDGGAAKKPPFLTLHHKYDGINDFSCHEKIMKQLRDHGYQGEDFVLETNTKRSLWNHLWQSEYNRPILDFFTISLKK